MSEKITPGAAQALLDNPCFQMITQQMEDDLTEQFINSRFRDDEKRTESALRINAIRSISEELQRICSDEDDTEDKGIA